MKKYNYQEIKKHLRNIQSFIGSPMQDTVVREGLNNIIKNIPDDDELEQAKRELNIPIAGKVKKSNPDVLTERPNEIIETANDILMNEFDYLIEKENNMESKKQYDSVRERILNKLREKITGKTSPTLPLVQVHAIRNFWFANHNLSWKQKQSIVSRVFDNDEVYNDLFKNGYKCDFSLFLEVLAEDQQAKLINHIMNNYNGVSFEQVSRYAYSFNEF